MARHDADVRWAVAGEALATPRAGFAAAAYFQSGTGRDPTGEAAEWSERLRRDGLDAVVESGDLPRHAGVGGKGRRQGATLLVPEQDRERAFELLVRAGGGLPLIVPPASADVLMGEAPIVDFRDKSGNGAVVTATRAIRIRGNVVRVVPLADVTGLRAGDESGLYLHVRDGRGRDESWIVSSAGEGYSRATLLALAAPDVVRSIFDQVVAGVDTGAIASQLKAEHAFAIKWDRAAVRDVVTSREVEWGSSAVGIVAPGTWQDAQFALERERARRGVWRERVRPRGRLLVPLLIVATIGVLVFNGVRDALTPRGSTPSKPYWLNQQGRIDGGWELKTRGTGFWPSAPAAQLVVRLSLVNEGTRPRPAGLVLDRLRLGNTHGARHPARQCFGRGGILSGYRKIAPGSSAGGFVCFNVVVLHPAKLRLAVEPLPGTPGHVVWFGLVDAPTDNGGDAGD